MTNKDVGWKKVWAEGDVEVSEIWKLKAGGE